MIELPQRRAHHWENHQSLKRLPVFFQNSLWGKTRSRQTVKCANFRPDPICWINFPTPISSSPTSCGVQSPWWLFKAGGTKALSGSDLGSPAGLGITGVSMHCANTLMTISSISRMVRMIVVMIEGIFCIWCGMELIPNVDKPCTKIFASKTCWLCPRSKTQARPPACCG